MKLLVDCHGFDFDISQGITTYIKGLYSSLIKISPDIEFYFLAQNVDKIKAIFGNRENIHYLSLSSSNKLYRILFEIPQIIKQHKIDIAHFQYISPLIKNCKTIVTLHDILFIDYPQYFPLFYRISKTLPFKLSAKRADLLCTVSDYSKNRIAEVFKIDKNEIIITPNAVDPEFYNIEGERPKHFPDKYILYVSRIEPRKNHKALLESYLRQELHKREYKLVFIGKETVPTPELSLLIESLPSEIKDQILLIPQCSFNNLKQWYKQADLFVYPSLAEGFGIPPIEAAVSQVPVVCNNATAMSDFKFFGKNLIDISNPELLDSAITEALTGTDKADIQSISENVNSIYNWNVIAKDFHDKIIQKFDHNK